MKTSSLHEDQRGAVMATGVFMCMSLIGSLWFIIGIGDAIVYRDRLQEATDHAAFASAAIHAKGMNFIAACNLILLVLTAIHVIMGLLTDILLIVSIISLGRTTKLYDQSRKAWERYASVMPKIARVVNKVEVVAANGYPAVATLQGFIVGAEYDAATPTLSTSLVPGNQLVGAINRVTKNVKNGKFTGDPKDAKKGLPVQGKEFSYLCEKFGRVTVDAVLRAGGIPNEGGVMSVGGVVQRLIKALVAPAVSALYCEGGGYPIKPIEAALKLVAPTFKFLHPQYPAGFWASEGPLVPWGGGENGNPWYQVWSLGRGRALQDTSESKVGMAQNKFGLTSPIAETVYTAEAEFFFDCEGDWPTAACNGAAGDDNAGFAIKWRARLVRTELPALGTMLGTFGLEFLKSMTGYKELKDKLNAKGKGDLIDQLIKEGEELVWMNAVEPGGKALDPKASGIYH